MRVNRGRTYVTSDLTIDGDLDFLTLYQVKRLAAPASGEALRKGNRDIGKAEIATDAGILLSQLEDAVCSETEAGTIAAALIAAATKIVRKPDDEVRNNTIVLTNDEDLVIPVGANDVWLIHLVLFVICASVGVDIDYAFAVPAGGAVKTMAKWETSVDTDSGDGTAEVTLDVKASESYMQFIGLYIGGGTGGNLQFQWAQNVATVVDTKILANSLMLCHRIA